MKLRKILKSGIISISFILVFSVSCTTHQKPQTTNKQFVDKVYPQLDTENSRWFFFSSASRPFGMVNLSPDTQINGAWGSGYRYKTDTIKGFSHIHAWQMSGVSVMPVVTSSKNKATIFTDFYSNFSHEKEIITPGYQFVELERYDIKTEITSTKRVGFHKYNFPKGKQASILFNLNTLLGPSKNIDGILEETGDNELSGKVVMVATHRRPKPVTVYFKVYLDTPIKAIELDEETGNYLVDLVQTDKEVLMKVGISYTSIDNANNNIQQELEHWNFDDVISESKEEWNELLGRIDVEGATEKAQRRFYTDLWHALQGRRTISDVNGAYPDNTGSKFRVGQIPLNADGKPTFNHYNSDAFWGAQWTINTLWGLAYPEIMEDFVHSLMQYYKDGGMVARGPAGGNYTFVMTGASSTPFIVSAIQKGIVTNDLETIYEALKKGHELGGIMEKAGYEHNTSIGGGLGYYIKNGYVPYPIPEGEFGYHQDSPSLTMEYAYQDWTLAQLAKKLKRDEDYQYFLNRSNNYKNTFDKIVGWMRPKDIDGKWLSDFDPYKYETGFNESNGAQSTWFVPHDISGLAELMGGKDKAVKKLNEQFETAELLGFTSGGAHDKELHPELRRIPINYGNQPSMQTAFVFNQLNRPDLSQYWSRKIIKTTFSGLAPNTGYNGDEDQGLMGSLNVLMKIGLFQMNGGTDENPNYQIGSPIFDKVTIQLNPDYYSGKSFVIEAENNSDDNVFVSEMVLNNSVIGVLDLTHSDIVNGGKLELKMAGSN